MTRSGNQSQSQSSENYGERIARLEERVAHVQTSVACLSKKVLPIHSNFPLWEFHFEDLTERIAHIESMFSPKVIFRFGMAIGLPFLVGATGIGREDIGSFLLKLAEILK